MSLRGKDFRCEIDTELHERLRTMAEFHDTDMAALGAKLLEKAICGEFHEFSLLAQRLERSGIVRKAAESCGTTWNAAEARHPADAPGGTIGFTSRRA